jgi:DNA replication protein DnaC
MLRKLHLRRMREIFPDWIDKSSRDGASFGAFLGGLLAEEVAAREERRIARLLRQADFPFIATLEQFDFRHRPELRRQVFQSYLDASFIRDARAVVLVGSPGLGKTHLAIAVGIHHVQRGFDVRCVQVQTLVNRVLGAETIRERERLLRPYSKCDLLVLDELGYLAAEEGTGPLLYQLIAQRYEKRATIITTNKSLPQWGRVLSDTSLALALIDRLMHHGDVYYLKGPSIRLQDKEGILTMDGDEPVPEPPVKRHVTKQQDGNEEHTPLNPPHSEASPPPVKRNVTKKGAHKDG